VGLTPDAPDARTNRTGRGDHDICPVPMDGGAGRVRRRRGRLHGGRRWRWHDRRRDERRAGHLHLLGHLRGHDRLGPRDRLLERGHRPPQHLRDADAIQRRDAGGRAAPRRVVEVVEGRPHVDVHAPRRRDLPHGQPAHRRGREGRDRADDGDRRGGGLHLGRGEEDRRARRHDARLPSFLPLAAGPRLLGHVLGLHLRHHREQRSGSRRLVRRRQRRGRTRTTGVGGTTPITTSATSSA
jgi:hypothetical protein